MTASATSWTVGEAAASRKPPLGKFGCKSVQRVRIRPISIRPTSIALPDAAGSSQHAVDDVAAANGGFHG